MLLHAVGCRHAHLVPRVDALRERYRAVTCDQRWHGRGIVSEHLVPVFVQALNTTSARVRDTPGKCR